MPLASLCQMCGLPDRDKIVVVEQNVNEVLAGAKIGVGGGGDVGFFVGGERSELVWISESRGLIDQKLLAPGKFSG